MAGKIKNFKKNPTVYTIYTTVKVFFIFQFVPCK